MIGKTACAPVRVLFVLGWPDGRHAETVAYLAEHLTPYGYRTDTIICAGGGELSEATLRAFGMDVDSEPCNLSSEDRVAYLAHRLPAYDIVVCCQDVADIHPALASLHWRPPLIEADELVPEATAGPWQFIADDHVVREWHLRFVRVLAERKAAGTPSLCASFVQGGFECSTHVRADGRRLDLLAATAHDSNAAADYRQLRRHGILTVRDGVRWHLIERNSGQFDWSSFVPMLRAARDTRTQVIWDLMHYGWPDGLDIWSPKFVSRFARYAAAVARLVKSESDDVPFYCPINEISFHAWAGGDVAYLNPFARGRSFELKAQLARAAIEAMQEILVVDPRARFVHCEPVINIVSPIDDGRLEAERARQAQFQAFDMIAGTLWPQLGGEPRLLDIVGINYYRQNQWELGGATIETFDRRYRPFRSLVAEVYSRYGRTILVSETGTEGDDRRAWFETIAQEAMAAREAGIPLEGICLYPIIDHCGWDDDRDCPSGFLANRFDAGTRPIHEPLASAISDLQRRLSVGPHRMLSQG